MPNLARLVKIRGNMLYFRRLGDNGDPAKIVTFHTKINSHCADVGIFKRNNSTMRFGKTNEDKT